MQEQDLVSLSLSKFYNSYAIFILIKTKFALVQHRPQAPLHCFMEQMFWNSHNDRQTSFMKVFRMKALVKLAMPVLKPFTHQDNICISALISWQSHLDRKSSFFELNCIPPVVFFFQITFLIFGTLSHQDCT